MFTASGRNIICRGRLSYIRPGRLPVNITTGQYQDHENNEQQDPYVL